MYLTMPSGIEEPVFARAVLSGLAGLNVLSARTKSALDLITEAGNLTDWRDEMNPDFLAAIRSGNIRCDALWTRGADSTLSEFAKQAEYPKPTSLKEEDDLPI